MERYALWRRPDGQLLDPWLRTHERVGGRYAGIAPHGNVFVGTVAEWQQWTGMTMPESGDTWSREGSTRCVSTWPETKAS